MAKKLKITNHHSSAVPYALVWKDRDPVEAGLLEPGAFKEGHAVTYNPAKGIVVLHSDLMAYHFRLSDDLQHEIL